MQTFVPVVDKKHPLRRAVYDRFMRRNPLKTKVEVYNEIAEEFGISVSTVQRYLKTVESGVFIDESKKQGRHVYVWDDEALSFFTNFYLAAMAEVGGCTVTQCLRVHQEACRTGRLEHRIRTECLCSCKKNKPCNDYARKRRTACIGQHVLHQQRP